VLRVQLKVYFTLGRTKKIVVGFVIFSLSFTAVNLSAINFADNWVLNDIYNVVFRALVPVTVLLVNVMVVHQLRQRNAAKTAELHQQSAINVVPTVMLVTTSLVYFFLNALKSASYFYYWQLAGVATCESWLQQQHALVFIRFGDLIFAYNFYVYMVTGRQFRADLSNLICSCRCPYVSAANEARDIEHVATPTTTHRQIDQDV